MRLLLVIVLTLFCWAAFAEGVVCEKHPIYCQIVKNNNHLDREYAMDLSNVIHNMALKYNFNARLFTAILMQESAYNVKAVGCHFKKVNISYWEYFEKLSRCDYNTKTSKQFTRCADGIPKKVKQKVCTDFGIGQINEKTIQHYEFDINSLLYDLEYSVEAAAIVLKDFQTRYQNKEWNWWTRYNASSNDKREIYRLLVSRYL
jgi:hypothetical protein